jgi:glycosyltransferase involved in cell wall biosynthesis
MSSSLSVSFIIPTYNAEKTIEQCLMNVISESKNFLSEIIIIDDCSEDKTSEIIKKFNNVRNYKIRKNSGVGYVRNVGSRLAKNKILCYVDSDLIISKNSVYNLIEKLIKNNNIGSVGAIPESITLTQNSWSSKFVGLRSAFGFEEVLDEVEVSDAQSEFFVIYKDFLKKIGGWKYYRNAGGEEYELGHRINFFNKKNLKIKNATYTTYWSNLLTRFKKNIDRTEKYIQIFSKRKRFDSQGSGASSQQAMSALLTTFMCFNFLLFLLVENNTNLLISFFFLLVLQVYLEFKFLLFAKNKYGLKMFFYSIFGVQVLNIGILIGGLFFLYNLFIKFFKTNAQKR